MSFWFPQKVVYTYSEKPRDTHILHIHRPQCVGWCWDGVFLCHPPPSRWLTLIDKNSAAKDRWQNFFLVENTEDQEADIWLNLIHQTSWPKIKNIYILPVDSVWSLEPSVLVTLQEINVFLPSFLSRQDSINTVLPSGMGLKTKQLVVRENRPKRQYY